MVGRQIQEHGNVEHGRRHQLELVARQFEHKRAVFAQRLEREHGRADIAADLHGALGRLQHMADQRRRRRFAVRARDADIGGLALRAHEQFDVADEFEFGRLRACCDRMRGRMRVRNAGRNHEARELGEIGRGEIDEGDVECARFRTAVFAVVPRPDFGSRSHQGTRRRKPRLAEAQHAHRIACERIDFDHALTAASASRDPRAPGWRR